MNKFSEYFKRPTSREHAQRATTALAKSVGVILASDDGDESKQKALAETFAEFDDYMQKHVTIDDADEIAKARSAHGGLHGLGAAVTEHLIDRLSRLRQQHDFEKTAKDHSMDIEKLKAERTENLLAIGKAGGAVAMAKILVADNDAHGIDESEYTQIVTEHAQKLYPDKTPDSAFAKLFSDTSADGVLLRTAHAIVKAAPFDIQPTMVGGLDAQNAANDSTESSEAYAQLEAMAQKMRVASPELSAAQAFERIFTDRRNAGLAAKAHVRPTAPVGGAYPFPR
jgi:hypothetical protein